MSAPRPPRLAEALLARAIEGEPAGAGVLGDLEEEYRARLGPGRSRRRRLLADAWYWIEALRLMASVGRRRAQRSASDESREAPRGRPSLDPPGRHRRPGDGGRRRQPEGPTSGAGTGRLETLWLDLRFAVRTLSRSPGFTVLTVLILGLGIGANTAVFSVVEEVLLRPLPYPETDRLLLVRQRERARPEPASVSLPDFADYERAAGSFDELAFYTYGIFNVGGIEEPTRLLGYRVSPDFFETLGTGPVLGNLAAPSLDPGDAPAGSSLLVASHGFWRQHLGGGDDVLGRTVRIDGRAHTVVAVMPATFRFPSPEAAFWIPLDPDPDDWERDFDIFSVVGRLGPGATREAAVEELAAETRRLAGLYPQSHADRRVDVVSLREGILGDVRPVLLLLQGAVGAVLLVACIDVASLFLMRLERRRREIGLRRSLGASRGRLLRQLLTEGVLLATSGGLVAAALAGATVPALVAASPGGIPRLDEVGVDAGAFLVCGGVSLLSVLLFALPPALAVTGSAAMSGSGAGGGRSGSGRRSRRLQKALVVAEVALAFVLVFTAAVLTRSFARLGAEDPGFRVEDVLTFSVSLPIRDPSALPRGAETVATLVERIEALPGVVSAGATLQLPIVGADVDVTELEIEGVSSPAGEPLKARLHVVSPGYFATMGIPIVEGRGLEAGDDAGSDGVVVVNRALARRVLPDGSLVGRRLVQGLQLLPGEPTTRTIVGVVGNVRHFGLGAAYEPQIYVPHRQTPWPAMGFAVRTRGDPVDQVPDVRDLVASVDPTLPISEFRPLEGIVSESLGQPRFRAFVVGAFSGLALLLAAVGLYGVLSQAVTRRRTEIGVRVALGARRGRVVGLVAREALALLAGGLGVGWLLALGVARSLTPFLHDVPARDPASLVAMTLTMVAVGGLAAVVPTLRATAVDPRTALSSE